MKKIVIWNAGVDEETARFVRRRDRYRCQVKGCQRRSRLSIHHIIPRQEGGGDNPENLILLCEHHHNLIELEGIRNRALIENYPDEPPEVNEPEEHTVSSYSQPDHRLNDLYRGGLIIWSDIPGLARIYIPPAWTRWVYGSERNPTL